MAGPEERLRRRIAEGGAVPFALFMEEALYGEGGYYRRLPTPIGPAGDFVTASSSSRFFGQTTANLLQRLDQELGRPADFLEVGYGSGRHLAAVLEAIGRSGERRVWGCERGSASPPPGAEQLGSLEALDSGQVAGLIFSYELFDALPVHRVVRRCDDLRELMVTIDRAGEFDWCEGELTDVRLERWNAGELVEGQVVDVTPAWGELYERLAARLGRGLVVTCDYGLLRERLLDGRVRRHGTLACYRRHRVHRNPFTDVGRQDLTAHVDFSDLIAAGERAGLVTAGLYRQAEWLVANGLLSGAPGWSPDERIAVQELVNLEGVGEELRVLVQGRGVDFARLFPELA